MVESKVIPVKVALRCRPLIAKEKGEGCRCCLRFIPGEPQLILGSDKSFTFDYVHSPDSPQNEVYEKAVSGLVKGLFKGYNATVLAYGQTGSGKTYTMGGGYGVSMDTDEEMMGVIPRVIYELFEGIDERSDFEFCIKVSYLELYKEELMDLLVPADRREKEAVHIREDVNGGIKMTGLTEVEVKDATHMMRCLETGSQGRTTGATAMNSCSSRSHSIFTIHMDRTSKSDSDDFFRAKFHLVDLAGSERVKKTHAEGDRFKEGVNINMGLLALGNVISALGEDSQKKSHIPYRDSKLTRLLQDSLGGNSHTLMVACVSPADSNMEETLSTLRYADRARKIKNKPVVNRDPQVAEILRLRQLVQDLQMQMLQSGKVPINTSGSGNSLNASLDYQSIKDKCKDVEEENRRLQSEVNDLLARNGELINVNFHQEDAIEKLQSILDRIKQKTGMSSSRLETTQNFGDRSLLAEEDSERTEHISMLKEIADIIETENENEPLSTIDEEEENTDESTSGPTENKSPSTSIETKMSKAATKRRVEMHQELQELNKRLTQKQSLAKEMVQNEEQMTLLKTQYEVTQTNLQREIEHLQREKEDLQSMVDSARTNTASNKISEQRRKRLKELEEQMGGLRKKMNEQNKMLKMKAQTDKQLQSLNQEIQSMKQQRVKLVKQIREETAAFRKCISQKEKEVMQLKAKDRKRLAEICKLEKKNALQQTVLRRKAEEAAAANKRLKDALMRKQLATTDRLRRVEQTDMSGVGSRIRKFISEELEVLISVAEAKRHLEGLREDRKALTEEAKELKETLEDRPPSSKKKMLEDSSSEEKDEETISTKRRLHDLQQQVELTNAQIQDLNQKVLDADQDEKIKSRWNHIHTMIEAKCAMKFLLNEAVVSKTGEGFHKSKLQEVAAQYQEATQAMRALEHGITLLKQKHDEDTLAVRRDCEKRVLTVLNNCVKNTSSHVLNSTQDESLKERLQIQEAEIERLSSLEEALNRKSAECQSLKKELSRLQYQQVLGRGNTSIFPDVSGSGDCMDTPHAPPSLVAFTPAASTEASKSMFFSPAFLEGKAARAKKRSMQLSKVLHSGQMLELKAHQVQDDHEDEDDEDDDEEDEDIEDEEEENDPDWKSGATPGAFANKVKRAIQRERESSGSMEDTAVFRVPDPVPCLCACKGTCGNARCRCVKARGKCSDNCKCNTYKCENRQPELPQSTTGDEDTTEQLSVCQSTLNTTFNLGPVADQAASGPGSFQEDGPANNTLKEHNAPPGGTTTSSSSSSSDSDKADCIARSSSSSHPRDRTSSENKKPSATTLDTFSGTLSGTLKKKRKLQTSKGKFFDALP